METIIKKSISHLCQDYATIKKEEFAQLADGREIVVSQNNLTEYRNSPSDRLRLESEQEHEWIEPIMKRWGDTPTVADPEIPKPIEIPNTEKEQEE